jgi:hypothetical protein
MTRLTKERETFLNINDINDISFFGTPAIIVLLQRKREFYGINI